MTESTISQQPIAERVAELEARLRREAGLEVPLVRHFRRPEEREFTAHERAQTTILFGGLTATHDHVIGAALEGLGYRVQPLPVPDNGALAVGKEFCNRGQCNPTYYTVGNLVRHLQALRAAGVQDIDDRYVFATAGACGPCRFGMYESEYRKALQDAGFPRFRVLAFQKTGGFESDGRIVTDAKPAGIALDARFYVTGLRALVASDIVNALGYAIRPYEVIPGATNAALHDALEAVAASFRDRTSTWRALRRARALLNEVEVDYTRVRARAKMTGQFWALTTEGDGSYELQSWLETEGAEVVPEPVGTWVEYMLTMALLRQHEHRGLQAGALKRIAALRAGSLLFRGLCTVYRSAVDFRTPPLVNQSRMIEAAADYYDPRIAGGEGHMEVAKHILATTEKKAHMVVSIKPFGCMPSTQSDGVQSKVVARLKDSLFIPIETTGDGEVNVKSRVQMKLFEAKLKAREEMERALEEHGVTLEQVRERASIDARLRRPMLRLPHVYAGTSANFVARVAADLGHQHR
jgi:predicted nucleotide-binding protein (sugar kinase/HSP70/actin superfamily)